MEKIAVLILVLLCLMNGFAQKNDSLEKLVATEKSFAKTADEKGTRAAFLEFLADDGLIFNPNPANGKEVWQSRGESIALLSWNPTFADISSNGVLGYTTGDWEFRPKGKTDQPNAFGQYMTIWRRQTDGNFKAVIDFGIKHEKPANVETNWKSPVYVVKEIGGEKSYAANTVNLFYDTAAAKGLSAAYKIFMADDVRFLRDGKFPIIGKQNALSDTKKEKSTIVFGKIMTLQSAGDFAYALTTFEQKDGKQIVSKGNTLQIWKLRDGKWQIVLDVMNKVPDDKK